MNVQVYSSIILLFLLVGSCKQKTTNESTDLGEKIQVASWDSLMMAYRVEGTMLVFDSESNTYYCNNFAKSEEGRIPASTYKIPHSLIALEMGIVESDTSILAWDGADRAFDIWEQDLTFRDAFQYSCVPCYQSIAQQIGVDSMQSYLRRMDYGNMLFDSTDLHRFWLTGRSTISPVQQIDFLEKLRNESLPFAPETIEKAKRMMHITTSSNKNALAKTGWARGAIDVGWYVGYIDREVGPIYFACLIENVNGIPSSDFIDARKKIAQDALHSIGIHDLDEKEK